MAQHLWLLCTLLADHLPWVREILPIVPLQVVCLNLMEKLSLPMISCVWHNALLFLTSFNVAAPFFHLVTYFAVGDRCTFVAIGLARPRGHYWRVCCLYLCLHSMLLEPSLCNTNSALVADAKFELRNQQSGWCRHGTIERMAWDGTGERLAVAFGGVVDAVYDGLVALFDTRQTPIVSMSLL